MISSARLARKFLTSVSSRREEESRASTGRVLRGKTARALVCFIALAALPYFVPSLARYRLPMPASVLSLLERRGHSSPASTAAPAQASDRVKADDRAQAETKIEAKPGEIEDPSGKALNHFFAALLITSPPLSESRTL